MAYSTSLYFPQAQRTVGTQFTSTDTTTAKSICTVGSQGTDIDCLLLTSSDTATVNFQLFVRKSSVNYLIGTVRAVTLVGTDGAANAIDLLNSTAMPGLAVNASGKRFLRLAAGDELYGGCKVTMTAGTVNIFASGWDY